MALNLAQRGLSRHVRRFETELRTTRLIRNGRGVMMAVAGKCLYHRALCILRRMPSVREGIGAKRDLPSGRPHRSITRVHSECNASLSMR